MVTDTGPGSLSPAERERYEALSGAESLSDLVAVTGEADEHDAYFAAKAEWAALRDRVLPPAAPAGELPGECVVVDGHEFHVHGITHGDTAAEREFVRSHVADYLASGATVYCEQGIRSMYLEDTDVCVMDDYRWALAECRRRDVETHLSAAAFGGIAESVDGVVAEFRQAAFSLIDSGAELYGEAFAAALGDVASEFLMSHGDVATGRDFESFSLSRAAAEDPTRLAELQRYYAVQFLPQPVEREWLRRHDLELEIVTHGRSERMADYAVAHNDESKRVHLVTGAAHQPGVVHYLERHRDGARDTDGFGVVH